MRVHYDTTVCNMQHKTSKSYAICVHYVQKYTMIQHETSMWDATPGRIQQHWKQLAPQPPDSYHPHLPFYIVYIDLILYANKSSVHVRHYEYDPCCTNLCVEEGK